jgi:competence ComEA-like helix-hairpin-helix protein
MPARPCPEMKATPVRGALRHSAATGLLRVSTRLAALSVGLALAITLSAAQAKILPPPHSVELNHATLIELEQLPETGPKLANAIIRFREKSGPFQRIEDLLAVPGITTRRLDKMRPYLRIDGSR